MQIPAYIETIIERRKNAAYKFNYYDHLLSTWLDKRKVKTESFDTYGGVESIVNPGASAQRIREAILNTEEKK